MIAKLRTVEIPPTDVETGVAYLREQMLPAARAIEGFVSMIGLVDRATGKAVTVTLWETADALAASEAAGARLRAGGGAPPHRATVERFDVIVLESASPAREPTP